MRVEKLKSGQAGNLLTAAKIGDVVTDGDPEGFGVLVGKTGRSFIVRFRVRGRATQYTRHLGGIDEIGLADARAEAHRVKAMARGGPGRPPRHPDQDLWDRQAVERATAAAAAAAKVEAEKAASLTFKAVAERYLDDSLSGGGGTLASNAELRRKLKVDLEPWHERPIGEITEAEIDQLVRTKAERAGVAGNRLLSFVKVIFGYAKKRHLVDRNAAADVEKPFREAARERYLSRDEIRVFWKACDTLPEPIGRLYQLLLVVGQRRGEVAGIRRSELGHLTIRENGKPAQRRAWLLPKERVKTRRAHALPLPDLAQKLIDGAPELKGPGDKVFDHLLASGVAGDAPVSGWSKYRRQLDAAIVAVMAEKPEEYAELDPRPFAEPWHAHDLRATVASHLEGEPLSIPEHVIARVLNHSTGPTMTRRYIRSRYDDEAAEAMRRWAERIEQIVGLNVKPLKRRGA